MTETIAFELAKTDRDIILRGLRYVRSATMMECFDATENSEQKRQASLEQIDSIIARLNGKVPTQPKAEIS